MITTDLLTGVTYTSPPMKPTMQVTNATVQYFKWGKLSQITVITAPERATALPIPNVKSIKKNSTAKSCNRRT